MKKKTLLLALIVALAALAANAYSFTMTGTGYKITGFTDSAKGKSSGSVYKLDLALHEPVIGKRASPLYKLCLGYYCIEDLLAPEERGYIRGTVLDTGSNPVIGATITATSADFDIFINTTGTAGEYEINGANISTYTIKASKSGYLPQTVAGIDVNSTETAIINFVLQAIPPSIPSKNVIVYFNDREDTVLSLGSIHRTTITVKNPENSYALIPLHIGSTEIGFRNMMEFEQSPVSRTDLNITLSPNEERQVTVIIFAGKTGSYDLLVGPDKSSAYDTKKIRVIDRRANIFSSTPGLTLAALALIIIISAAIITKKEKKSNRRRKKNI